MINRIQSMLENQDKLNIKTGGAGWRDGLTDKLRKIDWLRCIRAELGELINSFPWEHWKSLDKKADIDNAWIELTDTWFFLMSYYISIDSNKTLYETATLLEECFNNRLLNNLDEPVVAAEELMEATFNDNQGKFMCLLFVKLMETLGVDFDTLESLYYGKLALNEFRQDKGYKEGLYTKIWSGKEDNVYMLEIIREQPGINKESIYANLQYMYAQYAAYSN